ncbi:MAG: DNA primase [Lachnospiraceae bacterium]|nr:DNA primase [Lachnospiraceae bacterium]
MYYPDELIEDIRSRNDIVDVIGSYVNLKHKGNSYTACCPFHHEKTPSFHVSRERQMYHCFGCGVGGNVYTFLMEHENLTFPEAVETLAERAGVALPEQSMSKEERRRADERTRLKEMNKAAAGYFHYLLKTDHGSNALEYLKKRGLSDDTITKFGLGYSDKYRDDLYKYLKSKGYKDNELKDSGLAMFNEKEGPSDRFWNRVMFPIIDPNNKVIGFGGRVMGDAKPKYINSQDTIVFDKSRNLYGLNLAKKSKRRGIIFCEGYMDVISMHQAGFDNAVASLGTALTVGQVNLIKRYTDRVFLAYDSDEAGTKATLRALEIMREFELPARVISLKPYKDPDELISTEGTEAFEKRIEEAKSGVMFEIGILEHNYNQDDPQERTEFQKEIAKCLSKINDPLERNNYIESVAKLYNIEKEPLKEAVTVFGVSGKSNVDMSAFADRTRRGSPEQEKKKESLKTERILITWLVNDNSLIQPVSEYLTPEDFVEDLYRDVVRMIYDSFDSTGKIEPAAIMDRYYSKEEHEELSSIMQQDFGVEISNEEKSGEITNLVKRIKEKSIKYRMDNSIDLNERSKLIEEKKAVGKIHINLN